MSILAALAMLIAGGACAVGATGGGRASLGEPFELRVGESARLETEGVGVELVAVASDSRCPDGVQCVWEGDAVARVALRIGSEAPETRELHTAAREQGAASHRGYTVRLVRLDPPPVAGRILRQEDYRACLVITRPDGVPGEWQR